MPQTRHRDPYPAHPGGRPRIPAPTAHFWVVQILAVAAGETMADFLTETPPLGPVPTVLGVTGLFVGALVLQLRSRSHVPGVYWTTVVLAAVVATLLADGLPGFVGVSSVRMAVAFGGAWLFTLSTWYFGERSLSVTEIVTSWQEGCYWLTVVLVFALGTEASDVTSAVLGYAPAVLAFTALIGLVTAVCYRLGADAVVTFWLAYVLARPLGVSLGDALSYPRADGGLELGSFDTSVVFLGAILGLVLFLRSPREDRSAG